MNIAVNKFFLCLEFSQTTCLVLRITEKFETGNAKSLHNKQHIHIYVRAMLLHQSESMHSSFVVSVDQADNTIHWTNLFPVDSPPPFCKHLHVSAG